MIMATAVAASEHLTWPDAAGLLVIVAGVAVVLWILNR